MGLIGIEDLTHKVENYLDSMGKLEIIFITVIFAPFIEELLFRFPLRYPLLILLFFVSSVFVLILSFLHLEFDFYMSVIFIILILIASIVYQFDLFKTFWNVFAEKHFGYFFYWTVVTFAFMHSFNFELNEDQWFYVPILVMPQFILALLLGYLRMRKHFLYAVYIHSINNLVPILMWTYITSQ